MLIINSLPWGYNTCFGKAYCLECLQCLHRAGAGERRYPMSKVSSGSCE